MRALELWWMTSETFVTEIARSRLLCFGRMNLTAAMKIVHRGRCGQIWFRSQWRRGASRPCVTSWLERIEGRNYESTGQNKPLYWALRPTKYCRLCRVSLRGLRGKMLDKVGGNRNLFLSVWVMILYITKIFKRCTVEVMKPKIFMDWHEKGCRAKANYRIYQQYREHHESFTASSLI